VSRLTDLIQQAKARDPQLGEDLENEFRALSSRRQFGLNFERHRPEAVQLPQRQVRRGDKVRIMPPRGSARNGDPRLWRVESIKDGTATLYLTDVDQPELDARPLEDLVVVAEFRDTIYPGLVPTGRVMRGGEKPFHTVINGENFHVLEALTYTHRGRIDAIYIDPPYNTGARDWRYNNDYVEGDDSYRHSKWLAFMERRLLLARELLNPDDSVLIVTIDEKEYLRLGLLLEQIFPDAKIQMVSSLINPKGSSRTGQFARSDEYLFFLGIGSAAPTPQRLGLEWQGSRATTTSRIRWVSMIRSGTGVARADRPGMFFPVLIDARDGAFRSIGDALPPTAPKESYPVPEGTLAIWPIREDGSEGRWQIGPETARVLRASGFLRVGRFNDESTAISYLKSGERRKVEEGLFGEVTITREGHVQVEGEAGVAARVPTTQWALASHSASEHGSRLLRNLIPGREFDYPKSLYAVEDALRFFVADKPDATIVDFFAGSGTTAHAVMRLNHQDGGRRQCILVTNNEVAADQQAALKAAGLRPGDAGWERWGICDYITKPRVQAAITGLTPDGQPIRGEYKFLDEFPMADGFEENSEFFTLTYENPLAVGHNRAFERVAPLLWLRAGAKGRRIVGLPERGWDVADAYGILVDLDKATEFIGVVCMQDQVRVAFVVTDDDRRFQSVSRTLPDGVESVRLYESYLANFQVNGGERA
jgi:adenine-specific DNA-methyltransferase